MEIDLKKIKEQKTGKFIVILLASVCVLVALTPVKGNMGDKASKENEEEYVKALENELDKILENTYGNGTIEVMIYGGKKHAESGWYSNDSTEYIIDGVLIVANVSGQKVVSDITYAVSALFNLPAHKVAVLIKK